MKTVENKTVGSEITTDGNAIIEQHLTAGKPLDPEIARRIRRRAEEIRQRVFREYGLVDIAVPAIRELRGELPESCGS